jgi:hypothetical protein
MREALEGWQRGCPEESRWGVSVEKVVRMLDSLGEEGRWWVDGLLEVRLGEWGR